MSTRSIIALVVLAVLGLVGIGAAAVLFSDGDRSIGAIGSQSYGTTRYVLELSGTKVAGLESVDGCRTRGNVASFKSTSNTGQVEIDKTVSNVRDEPCVLTIVVKDQTQLFQWIKATLDGQPQQKDLRLWAVNEQYKALSEIEVNDGLISEIGFSSVGTGSTAAATIKLTVVPDDLLRTNYGANNGPPVQSGSVSSKQGSAGRFEWALEGVPVTESSKTRRVSGVTVKQPLTESIVGSQRLLTATPGALEIEEFEFELPWGWASTMDSWFHSFVVQGSNSGGQEKNWATLKLLDSTLTQTMLTLSFTRVGIYDARDSIAGEGANKVYSLYAEGLTLVLPSTSSTGTTTAATTTAATTTAATTTAATTTTATTTAATTTTETTETTETTGTAFPAPAGLVARLSSASDAELQWNPVEKAEGYIVLMALEPGGKYAEVARSEKPTVLLSKLEGGPPYYFVVRAVRGDEQSENSEEAEASG
jgi:T4-like virus tail tube protein gp19